MNPNIDPTNPPLVSPVFIDKVTATLPIDTTDVAKIIHIKTAFENLFEANGLKQSSKSDYERTLSGNDNTYGKDGDFWLQYGPTTNKNNNYMRFVFNPSKNKMGYVRDLIDAAVPDGYEYFIENAKLTRMDYTFDVTGLQINDLLILHPRLGIQRVYSKSKKMETIQMGSDPKVITIYDKCAHLKKLNNKIAPIFHHDIPSSDVTRIEMRHIRKLNYKFKEVYLQPNPFEKLMLILYPNSCCEPGVDPVWHLFVDMCRMKGVNRTLFMYFNKKDSADNKEKLLDEGFSNWFDPDTVWAGISEAMSVILEAKSLGPFTDSVIGNELSTDNK